MAIHAIRNYVLALFIDHLILLVIMITWYFWFIVVRCAPHSSCRWILLTSPIAGLYHCCVQYCIVQRGYGKAADYACMGDRCYYTCTIHTCTLYMHCVYWLLSDWEYLSSGFFFCKLVGFHGIFSYLPVFSSPYHLQHLCISLGNLTNLYLNLTVGIYCSRSCMEQCQVFSVPHTCILIHTVLARSYVWLTVCVCAVRLI